MPFAERTRRAPLLAALALVLAGCASGPKPDVDAAPTAATAAAAPQPAPPPSPEAQRAFDDARRLLAAGRADEAERAFAALVKSNPELGGAHANLGLIRRQAGKTDAAVADLERAVAASPGQPLYFNQLGIAYRQQGSFEKARAAYERAIELDASYAAPLLNLGILSDLYLGQPKRALELYEAYLALTPATKDATVGKWVADLKNRKTVVGLATAKKERE
jgi:tetratricopeptide (TPR) repeat protein